MRTDGLGVSRLHVPLVLLLGSRLHFDVSAQSLMQVSFERSARTAPLGETASVNGSQNTHWVTVTDCSAYMFNQGNMMLASAYHVGQPGAFTWIVYGCSNDQQRAMFTKLAHPGATAWHVERRELKHPRTGKAYKHFQASNRPLAVLDWWRGRQPQEEAIGILDPDEFFMRPVHLVPQPRSQDGGSYSGPWEAKAVVPKRGTAAMYSLGCIFGNFGKDSLRELCAGETGCMMMVSNSACTDSYASGPPWVLHREDAERVFGSWLDTAILTHEAWPQLLAEQLSYGVTQARFQVTNSLDRFWFLSSDDPAQPWQAVLDADYDPCASREPPPSTLSLPPLWHACSTWKIPHLTQFVLHKDHIHKDLLDCNAPLIHFPPREALHVYYGRKSTGRPAFQPTDKASFIATWAVCTYTNLVNAHAAAWKRRFCAEPNLEATFAYPGHAQHFLNESSEMNQVFRSGGWTDIHYRVGAAAL